MKLLFEIGAEELPAGEIDGAIAALQAHVVARCAAARLSHGAVETFATPRRLSLRVHDIAPESAAVEETAMGPAVKAAYDAEGRPTRAAEGFARGKGVAIDQIFTVSTPKGDYIAAKVRHEGRPARDVLTEALQSSFGAFAWKRSMRWGWETDSFARPIHWIVSLLDGEVLPIRHADVESGRTTRGHRFLSPGPIEIAHAGDDYAGLLRAAFVVASVDERKAFIRERVDAAIRATGATPIVDEGLIDEVVHLVEWPTPLVGTFDARYTEIPREVLTTTMRANQRYFAAENAEGGLANLFCFVSNMITRDPELVIAGNRRVLVARLEDARFFFKEDRKRTLESRVPELDRVVYIDGLGSVADRSCRMERVAVALANLLYGDRPEVAIHAGRAAHLCKADLVTGVVYQFADGEPAEVAHAIEEHYQPKGASDAPAKSAASICVALADKLDTLVGCFALGLVPTGSADPYALRRAALGLLRTAIDRGLRFDLRLVLTRVAEGLPGELPSKAGLVDDVLEFVRERLRHLLAQEFPVDIVQAVVAVAENDLPSLRARCAALDSMRSNADFDPLAVLVKRVTNIVAKANDEDLAGGHPLASASGIEVSLFEKPSEAELLELVARTLPALESATQAHRFDEVAARLVELKPAIDRFFDEVLVNAENPLVRRNRLALLGQVRSAFLRFADISRIQTQGG
jgi:glycyl-tRNA synthetase beta chain